MDHAFKARFDDKRCILQIGTKPATSAYSNTEGARIQIQISPEIAIEDVLLMLPDFGLDKVVERTSGVQVYAGTATNMVPCEVAAPPEGLTSLRTKCKARGDRIEIIQLSPTADLAVCEIKFYEYPRQLITASDLYTAELLGQPAQEQANFAPELFDKSLIQKPSILGNDFYFKEDADKLFLIIKLDIPKVVNMISIVCPQDDAISEHGCKKTKVFLYQGSLDLTSVTHDNAVKADRVFCDVDWEEGGIGNSRGADI